MRLIDTVDAVGHVLCHDITVIVKDVKKGVAFKKGHVVREEDIPELLKLGKEHLYVWEKDDSMLHEDEAAAILREDMEQVAKLRVPLTVDLNSGATWYECK